MKKQGLVGVLLATSTLILSSITFSNAGEEKYPFADPISVTDRKIDVTNLKTHFDYNPQDEYYSKQRIALDHVGNIKKVWDKTKGEGTTIAIIDSGIDWTHPDFYDEDGNSKLRMSDARYYAHVKGSSSNWRYPTSGETIYTTDLKYFDTAHTYKIENVSYSGNDVIRHNGDTSHGTNTASTAASYGHGNTDVGVIGIAPMAKILPIKVDMYMDSIGESLKYIYELNTDSDSTNNVDVINISICGASTWSTITDYAKKLTNLGTIIVASAGNDNVSTIQYPAGDPYIIGVGALENDSSAIKASFSNFNPTGSTSSSTKLNVDLTAPGHVHVADYTSYSTYKKTQGTSFSSPIVAGAAALWKSINSNKSKSYSTFLNELYSSCVDIGTSGWDTTFGYGRLDIGNLVGTGDIVDISSLSLPETATVQQNSTIQLTATVLPTNVTSHDYRWWSMNETVATVDHNGVVTGLSSGTATIYCKSLANDNVKDTCKVTVKGERIAVTAINLKSSDEITLKVNETSQISYEVLPSNATNKDVSFELVYDEGVLSVSSSGLITALKEGEEYVSVISNDDTSIQEIVCVTVSGTTQSESSSTTYTFTSSSWEDSTNSWTLDNKGTDLTDVRGIPVQKNDSGAGAHTVSISNIKKITINTSKSSKGVGKVTVKIGSENVLEISSFNTTATDYSTDFTGTKSGVVSFVVTCSTSTIYVKSITIETGSGTTPEPPVPTVTLESLSYTGTYSKEYTVGESFNYSRLTIYANYSDGSQVDVTNQVTWSPSLLTTSTTQVVATFTDDVSKTITFTGLTVHPAQVSVTGVGLDQTSISIAVGETSILTATISPSNASNKKVTWSSSDDSIATVGNGVVTGISDGTATIYCRSQENDTIKATCTVTVVASGGETPQPYSGTYYNGISATGGDTLLSQLHTLMGQTHNTYTTYDTCKNPETIYKTDPGTNSSSVTDFYTQQNIGKSWGSGTAGTWNREHVWPQSLSATLWGETYGGGDLHHLRPVETRLNGTRGNDPFGLVNNRESYKVYSEKADDITLWYHGGYSNGGVFEPLDSVKGDVARILMYVYTHYSSETGGTDGSVAGHTGAIKITNVVKAASTYTAQKCWDLLIDWNKNDPVSTAEITRNEEVYKIQGNRNPFIDHPEYAEAIWGEGSIDPTPTKTLSSIAVSGQTTSFTVGSTFSFGGTVTATYSDNSTTNVTSSATFSGYDMSSVGSQTVTVSYTENDVTKTTTYGITINSSSSDEDSTSMKYKLCTSESDLNVGSKYIFGSDYATSFYVTGKTIGNNISTSSTAFVINDSYEITIDDSVLVFQLGGDSDGYTFKTTNYPSSQVYLDATSSTGNNYLKSSAELTDYSYFSISFNNNSAVITCTGKSSRNIIKYNSDIKAFSCYSNGQSPVYLYKQVTDSGDTPTATVHDISIPESLSINMDNTNIATIYTTITADNGAVYFVNWSSSDETVARVEGNNSSATITALKAGSTTITASINGTLTDSCLVTVTKREVTPLPSTDDYTLVTDVALLQPGDTIVIANKENEVTAAGISQGKAYLEQVASTFSSDGNTITSLGTGTREFTISGSKENGWTLTDQDSNVLGCSAAKSVGWGVGTTTWHFEVDYETYNATISNTDEDHGRILYNLGSSRFASYTSATNNQMLLPQIYYKTSGGALDPDKEISSIELTSQTNNIIYGSSNGSYDVEASLIATYTDKTTGKISPTSYNYTVNTFALGEQTIFAVYDNQTYTKTIKITNLGSSNYVGDEPGPINEIWKYTLTAPNWSGYITDNSSDGITFNRDSSQNGDPTMKLSRTYVVGTSGKYQFHKSTEGSICSKNDCGPISSITFKGSGDTLILMAGTSESTCTNVINGTISDGNYSFDLSSSNYHYFKITRSIRSQTTSIENLVVNVKHQTIPENPYSRTLNQQAEAWADYFITLTGRNTDEAGTSPCSMPENQRKAALQNVWKELSDEYNYMVSGSKDAFCSTTSSGTIAEAMRHYSYIVEKYGLTDFVVDGSNNAPKVNKNTNTFISGIETSSIIVVSLALVGSLAIGTYFFHKKREEA